MPPSFRPSNAPAAAKRSGDEVACPGATKFGLRRPQRAEQSSIRAREDNASGAGRPSPSLRDATPRSGGEPPARAKRATGPVTASRNWPDVGEAENASFANRRQELGRRNSRQAWRVNGHPLSGTSAELRDLRSELFCSASPRFFWWTGAINHRRHQLQDGPANRGVFHIC